MRVLHPTVRACVLVAAMMALSTASLSAQPAPSTDDFFSDATLDRLDLWIHSLDWEKLKANFRENDYYPANLEWRGITVQNVGIRSRGRGSRSGTKPGLRVDIDRYSTEQEFLGLKSFVLDNLTQDQSTMREVLAMKLFARMGLPAPREGFTVLYVNGEPAGVYVKVESIDKRFLGRVFGEQDGNTENDGYLFEYEYVDGSPYHFEYLGSDLASYAQRFEVLTNEKKPQHDIYSPVELLIRNVNEAPDAGFEAAVGPQMDLTRLARHIAVEDLIAENDGFCGYAGMNNFYMYRFEDRLVNGVPRVPQTQILAWDKDNAFVSAQFPIFSRHHENVLVRRALGIPAIRDAYLAALSEGATIAATPPPPADGSPVDPTVPAGPGWLEVEATRLSTLVRPAVLADTFKPYSNEEFETAVTSLLDFSRSRAPFIRCEVAKAQNSPDVPTLCSQFVPAGR